MLKVAFIILVSLTDQKPATQPALDTALLDRIPAAERLQWINRRRAIQTDLNAADLLDEASAAYRSPLDCRTADSTPAEQDAFRWLSDNEGACALRLDWPADRVRAVLAWLAANDACLAKLAMATDRPRCVASLRTETNRLYGSFPVSDLARFRRLAHLAAVQAAKHARDGEWDRAIRWNARVHRLAAFLRELPFEFPQANADGISIFACEQIVAFRGAGVSRELPEMAAMARRERDNGRNQLIIDECEYLYDMDALDHYYAWAREPGGSPKIAEEVDAVLGFEALADELDLHDSLRIRPPPFANVEAFRAALLVAPKDKYIEVMTRRAALWRVWAEKPLPTKLRTVDELERDLWLLAREHPLSDYFRCGNVRPIEMQARTRGCLDARLAAFDCLCAITIYQTQHGRAPAQLAELVPHHLAAVPLDPFNTESLKYRVSGTTFALYSVGPNLTDDGGTPLSEDFKAGDDMLYPLPRPEFRETR